MADEPYLHDYTLRSFGHDYTFVPAPADRGIMNGWGPANGPKIKDGDLLLLQHPDGGSTRYRVLQVRYWDDPPDMWHATVEFAPRVENAATFPSLETEQRARE